jgi:DNA-binding transcriptional ArsR family regulator
MSETIPIRSYFGDRVLSAGFMAVPHLLRRHYREIGLEEETFVFVLHLLAMVYDHTDRPRSLNDIAASMGKGYSTVRRYSSTLNQLGLVIIRERFRKGMQLSNDYDLTPLWERLASLEPASSDDDVEIGLALVPGKEIRAEHLLESRSKMSSTSAQKRAAGPLTFEHPAYPKMSTSGRSKVSTLLKNNKDRRSEESDVATTIFSEIISIEDAKMLVANYPACIPHATALVAKARTGHSPSGLLLYLVEHGWTPSAAAQSADALESSDVQSCPVCKGALTICGGMHGLLEYRNAG